MVMQLGMTDVSMSQLIPSEGTNNPYQQKLYSDDTANKADAEVEKIIKERYANAKKIVSENKTELDLIVETLMILETIVKPQIDFIHKNKTLPPEAIKMKEENLKKLQEKKENIVNVNDTVVDLKNEQVKNEITIVKNSENSNFEKKTKKSSSKSKKNID
jgi:cell division protease FtsH